jgi:ketosteroid isomerase-like protein
MSEHDAILFANTAFYAAFTAHDLAAMDKVWAKDRPVCCVHPGRTALTTRDAVMRSWEAILGNPATPAMSCHAEKVHPHGDIAIVTCVEHLDLPSGPQFLMSSNTYARVGAIWLMVHHHAGPVQVDPSIAEPAPKPALN